MLFRRKKGAAPEVPAAAPEAPASSADVPAGPPSTQFLTGDQITDRRTVQVLLEAIARVSEARDIESLLTDIVDRSIEITGAERGLLILRGAEGRLETRVGRSRGARPLTGELRFSTTVAKRVLDQLQPVRATVQSESEALELGQSVYDLKLRAVMCVPLCTPEAGHDGGRPAAEGVLYVDSRAATRQFSQRDLGLFAALAQHISIALENARLHLDSLEKFKLEQSLSIASAIQRDLMPPVPSGFAGWDLAAWYLPAEKAAGDFYDFARMRDGRLGVVVGDASGHGIGPALITASAQGSLRSYLRILPSPAEALDMLNQDLCERIEDGRFVTLYLAVLAEDGALELLDAGHSEALLWSRATGTVRRPARGGPALGMIPGTTYAVSERVRLDPGDVLLIHSDGLIDARQRGRPEERLGEEGLIRALSEAAAEGLAAGAIAGRLREMLVAASGPPYPDDVTAVVVRRT